MKPTYGNRPDRDTAEASTADASTYDHTYRERGREGAMQTDDERGREGATETDRERDGSVEEGRWITNCHVDEIIIYVRN